MAMNDKGYFVHEKALCESTQIGEGTRIWAFAHVLPGAKIGKRCNLCDTVFVENKVVIGDDCTLKNGVSVWDLVTLEDGVFLGPNCVFTNDMRPRAFLKRGGVHFLPTLLKKGVTIGANATIVCGVTIGEFAMIGAGAVVIENIPPHSLVVGNPSRIIGRVCFCGEKLDGKDFCRACERPLSENSQELAIKRISHNK